MSRRQALRRAGLGLGGLSLSSLLFGCAGATSALPDTTPTTSVGPAVPVSGGTVRVAFVSPRSGPNAELGAADPYVLGLVEKALSPGLPSGGKVYAVEIRAHDGVSQDPRDLLVAPGGVDLFLATGSPEVVTAVADTAEAAGIPCISTGIPWETWVTGRGADLDNPSPFKSTFHFGYGMAQLTSALTTLWPQVATNRQVGVLWPNDAAGKQLRAALAPALTKAGYVVHDPGPADTPAAWAAQIAKLKAAGCQILDANPDPAAFAAVSGAITTEGFAPRIAQFGEAAMLPSQIEAVGPAALHLSSACWWHPTWPYSSPLTGLESSDLAMGYQAAGSGRQWIQQLGSTMALCEVAATAIIASANPKMPQAVTGAMQNLSLDTMAGHLTWGSGPNENVVATPIAGGQWVKRDSEHLDFVICENSCDSNIPVGAQLAEYR
jgi:branched-chain amino acid transport system substrate-binding protein